MLLLHLICAWKKHSLLLTLRNQRTSLTLWAFESLPHLNKTKKENVIVLGSNSWMHSKSQKSPCFLAPNSLFFIHGATTSENRPSFPPHGNDPKKMLYGRGVPNNWGSHTSGWVSNFEASFLVCLIAEHSSSFQDLGVGFVWFVS